jgi:hypothetical protein
MSARILGTAAFLACVLAPSSAAVQRARGESCPWCKDDPERMQKAGIVSHGPIPIGPEGSAAIVEKLPASQWIFLETAHIRWASSLGPCNVEQEDKKRVAAELARLKLLLPTVPSDPKRLDPFLRLHLFAMKGEGSSTRASRNSCACKTPTSPSRARRTAPMGDGRYLGEKDKFEIVIHAARATHGASSRSISAGRRPSTRCAGLKAQQKVVASIPRRTRICGDKWLYPHVVHNLSHLCFDAYKHFSYDPPLWLSEGLALCMEKEIEPESTTNEGEEGGKSDVRGPKDWNAAARKLAAAGDQARLAQLMGIHEVGELQESAKITCWSMVRFLLDEHGDAFAEFLGGVKGQLDEQGYPSGDDLPALQRKLMKALWSWTPGSFDEAWVAWATRPPTDEKEKGR